MNRKKKKLNYVLIMVIVSLFLVLGFTPIPAPPLDPNDVAFNYDPNQAQSVPMAAYIIDTGTTFNGHFKVAEPDGEPVTFISEKINIEGSPYFDEKDPNDTTGICRIYKYRWTWSPLPVDVGIHYINVKVTDIRGGFCERTIIILVKTNQPPVITGCRSGS